MDASISDVTRRTELAAERTWLAWWRTGITTLAAAIGVGGIAPTLIDNADWLFVTLGAGYAMLALAIFVGAARRQQNVEAALSAGKYASLDNRWVASLTAAGGVLAFGTFAGIVLQL